MTKPLSIGLALWITLSIGAVAWSGEPVPQKPDARAKCPVCGMFVARYPDWVAQVIFTDGSRDYFDGAKDMFKYLFELERYRPDQSEKTVAAVMVTEYYQMQTIDARQAYFVVGSDVYGPMGPELIPFNTRDDAQAFLDDHKGRRVLTYGQITPYVIRQLDP